MAHEDSKNSDPDIAGKHPWSGGVGCAFNSESGLQGLTLSMDYGKISKKGMRSGSSGRGNISFARQLYTPFIPVQTKFQSYSATIRVGKQPRLVKLKKPQEIPVTVTYQNINSDVSEAQAMGWLSRVFLSVLPI